MTTVSKYGHINRTSDDMEVPYSVVQYLTNVMRTLDITVHDLRTEIKLQYKSVQAGIGIHQTIPKGRCVERTTQTHVYIRVVFLKVGDVDTLKENFIAKICMYARWREPLFDRRGGLYPGQPNRNLDQVSAIYSYHKTNDHIILKRFK